MSLNSSYTLESEGPTAVPKCPICDDETETLYENYDGQIIGCDNCIATVDAWEWLADQEELEIGRIEEQLYLKHLEERERKY